MLRPHFRPISSSTSTSHLKSYVSDVCENKYLNNSTLIVPLSITAHTCDDITSDTPSQLNYVSEQVFLVLKEILPGFVAGCTQEDLIIRNLTGGLSNRLLTVSIPKTELRPAREDTSTVLVRLHTAEEMEASSSGSSNLFDRNIESQISAELSRAGIAPIYYGRFQNGRIEEFYDGMRTVTCYEMRDERYAKAIAVQLAILHKVKVSSNLLNEDDDEEGNDIYKGQGQIWRRIENWICMAKSASSEEKQVHNGDGKTRKDMILEMESEWDWLKLQLLHTHESSSPLAPEVERAIAFSREVVFAHNDCQSLNILTPVNGEGEAETESFDVRLIDFEYAGMNPRGVDLGNTFAEYCDMNNLIPDYEHQYPTPAVQDAFLSAYIKETDVLLSRAVECEESVMDKSLFFSTLRDQIGKYSLLSHLGWAAWAVLQSSASSIEFDYMTYAAIRLEGYRYFKSKYWTKQH
jgi:thiamine kinase-like enzyme